MRPRIEIDEATVEMWFRMIGGESSSDPVELKTAVRNALSIISYGPERQRWTLGSLDRRKGPIDRRPPVKVAPLSQAEIDHLLGLAPQGANKEQGCRHEWAILCFNPLAWPKDAPQVRCSKCGVVQSRRASDRNLSTGTDGDASPAPQATRNCPRGIYCGWGLCRHTAHCPYAGHV